MAGRAKGQRAPEIQSIVAALAAVGSSKAELARKMGLSARSLREWGHGKRRPSEANLRQLIAHLENLDAKIGAKLRFQTTGEVIPPPPAPSFDPVVLAIHEAADDLDTSPRRVRAVFARLLAVTAAQGLSVQAASAALAEWIANADRATAARAVDARADRPASG